ncbi:MAG: tetratricopeptide repeat protein [Acidobacteria bacterium]|nr:tetratricopeptide repeat protein [Acidobacteriota bacterium]
MRRSFWLALAFGCNLFAANDCLPCHTAIAEAFAKTGMGRSITVRPAVLPGTFSHPLSNRHYTIEGGKMKRHQRGPGGAAFNVIEKTIDVAIGSGNHAITYGSRTPNGMLLELPVSWYSQEKAYFMSPGYDQPAHFDMRREITESCLFCHSDSAQPAAITCRRCHGDAAAHLAQPGRGNIYNPQRSSEVCFQCHLETESMGIVDSMRKPGRDVFSYWPGEPLADYKLYFDRADPPAERFEVNHTAYRLIQSACYQKSAGKLACVTCHDPHSARAREACGTCHQSEHTRAKATGCAGCHMPKRKAQDALHITMTDHWIQRAPKFVDPVKENHEPYTGKLVPFYTKADPLLTAIANVRVPDASSARLYEQYLQRAPKDVPTLIALGKVLIRLDRDRDAEARLRRALALAPREAEARLALAVAIGKQGDIDGALREMKAVVAAVPDDSYAWLNLGLTHRGLQQFSGAAAALREAIRLQPDLAVAQQALSSLPAAK